MATTSHPDWSGGSYTNVLPLSFSMMILGVYIAGVRTGRLDVDTDLPPFAEEAAMDRDDRRAARLLGLAMPVGLAFVTTIGIAVVSRIEGGFWMGEGPAAQTRRCTLRSSCSSRRSLSLSRARSGS